VRTPDSLSFPIISLWALRSLRQKKPWSGVQSIADHYSDGKEAIVLELILYMERRGRITELLQYCINSRPEYPWPQDDSSVLQDTISREQIAVLFLASDPSNQARLRLGQELREIQEKLQLANQRDRFELHQRMSVRPADISQALLDTEPQVVHFSGHGAASGELCFEDVTGQSHPVSPGALAALFEQFDEKVNCVILNACFSEIQVAAIAFAVGFYQALGAGRIFEEAYELGCVQIRLQGISEHLTPILIKKE
jgi:hypothetical protein